MKSRIALSALVLSLAAILPVGFPQDGQHYSSPALPSSPLIAWWYLQQPRPLGQSTVPADGSEQQLQPVEPGHNGMPSASQSAGSQISGSQIYDGVVTDTHCGAKHSAQIGKTAADCTRVCVHGGEQFALVDGDQIYLLVGDLQALKRVAGQRVRIFGNVDGKKLSVTGIATS